MICLDDCCHRSLSTHSYGSIHYDDASAEVVSVIILHGGTISCIKTSYCVQNRACSLKSVLRTSTAINLSKALFANKYEIYWSSPKPSNIFFAN